MIHNQIISSKKLFNNGIKILPKLSSYFFSIGVPLEQERLHSFRTTETNPLNHTRDHLGQFYTLDNADVKHLFSYGGLPKYFQEQSKTFQETCLMVREPTIDLINCINNIDFSKPAVRFVLYGKPGTGKSLCLAHLMHYAFKKDFLIVNIPWLGIWMRLPKDYSNSESREGFIEQNQEISHWLLHFKTQNAHILPNLKTTEDHVWSKREMTPRDSPIIELIEHGINRIKYASEVLIALCQEIKILSSNGNCKTLIAFDGFNAFFYPNTRLFARWKKPIPPNKVTSTEGFLNLVKFDWKNAVIVVTVDERAIAVEDQISYLPRYLLNKEGFELLDPFVPVLVNNYSEKEFKSSMDYFRERKWITPYPEQDEEASFVTANNPFRLMQHCISL